MVLHEPEIKMVYVREKGKQTNNLRYSVFSTP